MDLATPVVYKNWVFLLSTNYDKNLQGGGLQGTHGYVYALDLRTGGTNTTWLYPDWRRGEDPKLLPPFHDPTWVINADTTPGDPTLEVPPDGDNRPAVTTNLQTAWGLPVEAALLFHCPAQLNMVGANVHITATNGEHYAFIPTPADAAGNALLNGPYYAARLNSAASAVTSPAPRYDPIDPGPPTVVVDGTPATATDGASLAWFSNSEAVLTFLRKVTTSYSPLALRAGCNVSLSYTRSADATTASEIHFLPGPVAWVKRLPGTGAAEHTGQTLVAGTNLTLLDAENGKLTAQFNPASLLPPDLASGTPEAVSAPALDAQTALAALNLYPVGGTPSGAVVGLRLQNDFSVHLGRGLNDSVTAVADSVTVTFADGTAIPAADYTLDATTRSLTFRSDPDATLGTLAGKTILVTWTDTATPAVTHTGEMHVIPGPLRFAYVGGFLKLHHYPVQAATVNTGGNITLPPGTVAVNWNSTTLTFNGEPPVTVGGNALLPNGWLDLRQAYVLDALNVRRGVVGKEVLVNYLGWSEADQRWVACGQIGAPLWANGPRGAATGRTSG